MIYGAPFNRQVQLNRQFRRARPGLVRGRSETVAPVKFARPVNRPRNLGSDGAPGAPGPDGTARISRGGRMFSRPIPPFSFGTRSFLDSFRCDFQLLGTAAGGVPIVVPATTDVNGLPRLSQQGNGCGFTTSGTSTETFAPGGTGTGGFLITCQFAFVSLGTTGFNWFVGLGEASGAFPGKLTIGQDVGDTIPQFFHSAASDTTIVKQAGSLSAVVIDKIYEARFYWDPSSASAQMSLEKFDGGVSVGVTAYDTAGSPDVPDVPMVFSLVVAGSGSPQITFLGFYAEVHPGRVL